MPGETRVQSIASRLLACISVGLGLYAAIYAIEVIYRFRSPVPYLDHWRPILEFAHSGGHISLPLLWKQHHEHRILFGKLAFYFDLFLFGGKSNSLFAEILLIQMSQTALLIWILFRYGRLARPVALTAAGFFCFCMFFPIQIDNFDTAFQVDYLLNVFSSTLAIAAAVAHAGAVSGSGGKRWVSPALLLSFVAGIAAELTLANGLLIWPMIWLVGFALSFPRKTQWLIAGVGTCADLAFLIGYQKSNGPAFITIASQPWHIFQYIRTYFAFSWDEGVPSITALPNASEILTCVAIALVLIAAFRLFQKPTSARLIETFLIMNCLSMLGTAFITSFGRLNQGVVQATASRYQSDALLFWACFAGLMVLWLVSDSGPKWRFLVLQIALVALMASGIRRFGAAAHSAEQRQLRSATAYLALVNGDLANAGYLHWPQILANGYAFLKSNHIGPNPDDLRATVSKYPTGSIVPPDSAKRPEPRVNGYQVAGDCFGSLEAAELWGADSNDWGFTGWAWSPRTAGRATYVLLALEDGTVLGRADLTLARPDVPRAIPRVSDLHTGWHVELPIPQHAKVRAFIDLMSGNTACPLSQEFVEH